MINRYQFDTVYPLLAKFAQDQSDRSGNLTKGAVYLGGSGVVAKNTFDSGLTRLLGARLERHSTSKKAAKKILDEGGYLDTNKGVRKSLRFLEENSAAAEKLKQSQGYNFISGYHPNQRIKFLGLDIGSLENNPLRNVLTRRDHAIAYKAQSEIDFDRFKTRPERAKAANKNILGVLLGTKGKTLYAPVTDKEVLLDFKPDVDDPLALMTKKPVKVYGNKFTALLGHLKKNRLSQIKANPGRVATGAAIVGVGGAVATKLAQKGFAEIKAHKRNGKLIKAHKRKLAD